MCQRGSIVEQVARGLSAAASRLTSLSLQFCRTNNNNHLLLDPRPSLTRPYLLCTLVQCSSFELLRKPRARKGVLSGCEEVGRRVLPRFRSSLDGSTKNVLFLRATFAEFDVSFAGMTLLVGCRGIVCTGNCYRYEHGERRTAILQ